MEEKGIKKPLTCQFLIFDQKGLPMCFFNEDAPGECSVEFCPFASRFTRGEADVGSIPCLAHKRRSGVRKSHKGGKNACKP